MSDQSVVRDGQPGTGIHGTVSDSQVVAAPPGVAFEIATHAERLPRWHPFFVDVRAVSAPLLVQGATFDAVIKLAGWRLDVHYEVADVRVPDFITLVGTLDGGRLRWTRLFEAAGDHAVVRGELEYDLPGWLVPAEGERVFAEWAIARDMRHSLEYFAEEVVATASPR